MLSKEYLNHPALNQSSLKYILDGVDDFKWNLDHPREEMSDAQIIGSAVHILVLQPHLANTIIRKPKINGASREGKIFKLLSEGKDVSYFPLAKGKTKKQSPNLFYEVDHIELTWIHEIKETHHALFNAPPEALFIGEEDYITAEKMAANVLKNDDARELLSQCQEFERSYFFTYKGIKFKAQLDARGKNRKNFVVDLKSTVATMAELEREIYKRRYHFQAACYLLALANGQLDEWFSLQDWDYHIIFVRNEPPYTVIPKTLSVDKIIMGLEDFDRGCDIYNDCLLNNPEFKVNHRLELI